MEYQKEFFEVVLENIDQEDDIIDGILEKYNLHDVNLGFFLSEYQNKIGE